MCGLTGWVSFQRTLNGERDTALAMTETMLNRGPDAGAIWVDKHVFLGHRRLSVIDLNGGHQPMEAADDVVITYTGEVYNYRELRTELIALGYTFTTQSDTEVVLKAYLAWDMDFVDRLNGMYAFAIWDKRTEELLLVRDRMGIKPLYFYPLENGDVLFGSEPKSILVHPDIKAVVNEDGLREIFSIVKTPGHAIFQGMYEVRPGTIVKVTRAGRSVIEYWKLVAKAHTDDLETTIDTIKDLLTDIVSRQMVADVPVGTLLSGGLDSSTISALCAKTLEPSEAKAPLLAFTIDFVAHMQEFAANAQWEDPDTPFAIEVAKHIGAEHIKVLLNHDDVMNPTVRKNTLHAQDLPISTGDMEYSLYLLCSALKERVTVALSGEGADELFGGYTWFHNPEAVQLDSFPWHQIFSKGGGVGALRNLGLWDSLKLDDYVQKRYQQALAEAPTLPGESDIEKRMRTIGYLNLTRWLNFLLDRNDRISMAVGLEVRVPFLDHRLVEYVFNAPWEMKNFDGREKSLLRAAMRGVLPDSVLDRKKSPYPSTQDHKYELALRERLQAILQSHSPILQIVSKEKILQLLNTPLGTYSFGGPWSARAVLERLVEFHSWVIDYGVHLDLRGEPAIESKRSTRDTTEAAC